jgi:hypothetical protein
MTARTAKLAEINKAWAAENGEPLFELDGDTVYVNL